MRKVTFCGLAFILISFYSLGQHNQTTNEINEVLTTLVTANNELNGSKIQSLLVQDAFFKWIHEGEIYSFDDFNALDPQLIEHQSIKSFTTISEKSIRFMGNKNAVAICEFSVNVSPKDKATFVAKSINTIVLEKVGEIWLIAAWHTSGIRESRNF